MKRRVKWALAVLPGVALLSCATASFTRAGLFTSDIEGPAFGGDGLLYVANFHEQGTIGVVDVEGRRAPEVYVRLPDGGVASGLAFNPRGELLVADYVNHRVWKVRDGVLTPWVHEPRMSQPNDLAVAADGTCYLTDPDWAAGTGQLWQVSSEGVVTLLAEGLGTVNGIALCDGDASLYVSESRQREVWRYSLHDGALGARALVARFEDGGLDGLACGADGTLYVTRHGKGELLQLSAGGEVVRRFVLRGSRPSNVALRGGRAYVTEQSRGAIETVDAN